MVSIMLVDDHEVVRIGMAAMLRRRPEYKLIAEASTVTEAVTLAHELKPEIIIMDISLPDGSGIEACRRIKADDPQIRVLMLTAYASDEAMFESIMAGAEGFVLKMIGSEALLHTLEKATRGEPLIDAETHRRLLFFLQKEQEQKRLQEVLTKQEQRVLKLIAEGKTNKEIASDIFVSEKTVRNHVSNILNKLGLSNRTQAAALMLRSFWKTQQ